MTKTISPFAAATAAIVAATKPVAQYLHLSPDQLHSDPNNVRFEEDINHPDFQRLLASVKRFGLIEAITAVQNGDIFTIVTGHRRVHAARLAEIKKIPTVVVTQIKPDELALRRFHENDMRREMTRLEKTNTILSSLEYQTGVERSELRTQIVGLYNQQNSNFAQIISDTLEVFGIKLSTFVVKYLPTLNHPEAIMSAIIKREISENVGFLLARFHDSALQMQLLEQAKNKEIGESEIEKQLHAHKTKAKPKGKSSKEFRRVFGLVKTKLKSFDQFNPAQQTAILELLEKIENLK